MEPQNVFLPDIVFELSDIARQNKAETVFCKFLSQPWAIRFASFAAMKPLQRLTLPALDRQGRRIVDYIGSLRGNLHL